MKLIAIAAGVEVPTGLVLLIRPSLFVWLLFGAQLSDAGRVLGRLTAFTLLSLALACWPRAGEVRSIAALRALSLFSLVTTVYLLCLGVGGELVGPLLWPAAALHATLTILLARIWLARPEISRNH